MRSLAAIAPRQSVTTVVVSLACGVTEGVGLLLLVPLLQIVNINTEQGALSGAASVLVSALRVVGLRPTLATVLVLYVAVIVIQSVLLRRQSMLGTTVQELVITTFRNRIYRAIAGMRWIDVARTRSSDLSKVLTEDIGRVGYATSLVLDLAVTSVVTIVYLALAFRVSAVTTACVLLGGAVLAAVARRHLREARAVGEGLSASWTRLYAAVSEHRASLKIAKAYSATGRHADSFAETSDEIGAGNVAQARSFARLRQQLVVGSAALMALMVYLAYAVLSVSTADLLVLLFLFARLVPRLTGLFERLQALAAALPAVATVLDVEQHCLAAAEPAASSTQSIHFTNRILFDRVTFDYVGQTESPAVRDLTLPILSGTTTAIVGPSGAGKSTVADLLMGLLMPSKGRVLVDSLPLDAERLDAWRAQIAYVPQETFLFHDTIRANLLWAKPGATDDELRQALQLASADTFVAALPQGLDTVVGDRGVLLAGGECQRLSLARALLRRPKLLILDEATSSLDSENEARIQQAIDRLRHRMTIVIITHRLTTIRGADVIHVIDDGRLVESGTWDTLMHSRVGRFRALCLAQGIEDQVLVPG